MMQIAMGARQRGMDLEVMHPMQLLDEGYRESGQYVVGEKMHGTKGRQALFFGIGIGLLAVLLLLRRNKRSHV
jgi:glycolate oxidase iron-sulfur subunit